MKSTATTKIIQAEELVVGDILLVQESEYCIASRYRLDDQIILGFTDGERVTLNLKDKVTVFLASKKIEEEGGENS